MSARGMLGGTAGLAGLFVIGVVAGLTAGAMVPLPAAGKVASSGPTRHRDTTQPVVSAGAGTRPIEVRAQASPRPRSRAVTLAFAGDVMFEGGIRNQLDADPRALLDGVRPVLRAADLAMVNLETAVTDRGIAQPKQFTFRGPPWALEALTAAGVDVVSLANNHGIDFGAEGFEDTLAAAAARNLPLVGAGRTRAEAYAPFVASVRGRRVAVLAATQVMDAAFLASWPATADRPGLASAKYEHEERLVRAVRRARARADIVVVFLHWGVERLTCPTASQQDLARRLVEAGADVIVGGHAHRLQGAGMLDDALVAYGLGNFVFTASSAAGAESGILVVTIPPSGRISYTWEPARIVGGIPQPLVGDEAVAARASWEALRACTGLAARAQPPGDADRLRAVYHVAP